MLQDHVSLTLECGQCKTQQMVLTEVCMLLISPFVGPDIHLKTDPPKCFVLLIVTEPKEKQGRCHV